MQINRGLLYCLSGLQDQIVICNFLLILPLIDSIKLTRSKLILQKLVLSWYVFTSSKHNMQLLRESVLY